MFQDLPSKLTSESQDMDEMAWPSSAGTQKGTRMGGAPGKPSRLDATGLSKSADEHPQGPYDLVHNYPEQVQDIETWARCELRAEQGNTAPCP